MKREIAVFLMGMIIPFLDSYGQGAQSERRVAGWITPEMNWKTPPDWLGSDPVLGRLICPPLTRLNLESEKNEGVIIRVGKSKDSNGEYAWELAVRKGIYWWSEAEVNAKDVSEFLTTNLTKIVSEKGVSTWQIPDRRISYENDIVKVVWKSKPIFAPYVLSDSSFWRKIDNV